MKKKILLIILDILLIAFLYYFILPPINITSPAFWSFAIICFVIILITLIINDGENLLIRRGLHNHLNLRVFGKYKYFLLGFGALFILQFVINFICSPVFNADEYSRRIEVSQGTSFVSDVKEVDFTKIPLLDKESSEKLGDRKMGEASSWVSQFYVSDLYTQINYNNDIIRVTPIEYAGLIKYFTNRKEGIKGYITVNSVTGEAKLNNIEKGIKYTKSAYFFENLHRYLRIKFPFTIFDEASFEIDNEGNPYWIVPTIKYKGIGLKKEITGAIILDAISGKSNKYALNDIPAWVDHVFSADLIIEQLDDWGYYRNGFINAIFGQKDVINTTDGYNYLVMDDDVYLYTGITSVSTDESNLGFVLVNMRTKQTHYYEAPGAEEFSAMASAEGLVQEKKYKASFPLLINLKGRPTYLLSLKDDAGLVKMYAFIDVADYQKVVVNEASLGISAAAEKYLNNYSSMNTENILEKQITISQINDVVIDSNTYYYILDKNGDYYQVSIKVNKNILPFLKKDDTLKIKYNEGEVSQIVELEKVK